MKLHVKKNDVVVVLAGSQSGKSGKVLSVDPSSQRVIVEGVNVGRKTLRKSQATPQGGIVERERSIHVSNVMLESEYQERQAKHSRASSAE